MTLRELSAATMLSLAAVGATGCDDRAEVWDLSISKPPVVRGLTKGVIIVDPPANRVLALQVGSELGLESRSFPIGEGFTTAEVTGDSTRLLVLSMGIVPRREPDDEAPSLTVIDTEPDLHISRSYPLTDPLSGLAVDPQSEYAVIYPGADDVGFVQNPNELVIVDLSSGPHSGDGTANPYPMTLRSFGGQPQAFTFTSDLSLPGGERRLLIVQTDIDVAIVDFDNLDLPEITVPLTTGADALVPGGVAVTDGDEERDDDARIAIRVQDDPSVIIVDLLPVPADLVESTPQSFLASPNKVDVGGDPSDISFVQTDGGLRLAALVPEKEQLTLVDPSTGVTSAIDLGDQFSQLSVVTNIVGETDEGSDTALLWSGYSAKVAFVSLGSTIGKPYKSVDVLELPAPVAAVFDVAEPNSHLKLLRSSDGQTITVLNLLDRTASPISTSQSGATLTIPPHGDHAWITSGSDLAQLSLNTLHPLNIELSHSIHQVVDVQRTDGQGRALVVVHTAGAVGVTVLDSYDPSLDNSKEYVGVLLEGLK